MNQINETPQIHVRKSYAQDKYRNVPKDYLKVAQGMETQFTNHLLGEMRKTVQPTNPESQAQKIYKSMLDDERAKMMSESNTGLGVKDMVLDQIYPNWRKSNPQHAVQMYKQVNSQQGERNE